MTRRQILYLAHRIPYPPDKGDKIRTWNTLEHLTYRFDVHLAAFVDDPADFQHEAHLKGVCASVSLVGLNRIAATLRSLSGFLTGEPLTTPYYRDARMMRAVKAARRNNLVAEIGFSSSMAPYLLNGGGSARKIIDLCDADSAKWTAYSHARRGLTRSVYAREGRLLAVEETRIINAADAAFAISEEEADLLGQRDGVQREVFYFGNGVDTEFFAPGASPAPVKGIDVVFERKMIIGECRCCHVVCKRYALFLYAFVI
ncbi:MAG: hypothetical protein R3C60_14645 [Parvularculaceae bacterium]